MEHTSLCGRNIYISVSFILHSLYSGKNLPSTRETTFINAFFFKMFDKENGFEKICLALETEAPKYSSLVSQM